QSDSDIADYTQRVAQAWGVGQKERRNGVVLFVFVQDRKMFIQVGYGLEGALPDITAFDITEYRIKPHFRTGDYEGGIASGIDSIFKAIRGEYTGSGKTVTEQHRGGGAPSFVFFIIFVIALIVISRIMRRLGGYGYSSGRGGPIFFPGGGGGGWSSGGGGGGGFSGFSGGGGSFGGGGAGSSWRAMRTRDFLSRLEHARIVSAIREAESKTSGEIRVYIQRGKLNADPLVVAQNTFQRLV